MNSCHEPQTFKRLLSGELPPEEFVLVSEHLTNCSSCQSALDKMTDGLSLGHNPAELHAIIQRQENDSTLNRALEILGNAGRRDWEDTANTATVLPDATSASSESGISDRLDGYRIGPVIGRGGMGVVYRAFDATLQRTVAIKVLRLELSNADARIRFVHEARAVAKIRHDNVVAIHAVCVPSVGMPYQVMEYLDGPTLSEAIKLQIRLDPTEAVRWIGQAAEGLAAAHAVGIIHRDVKPSNLMRDVGTGRSKVMDFGLARHVELSSGLTRQGELAGTPSYMSPEQAVGSEGIDARTDVYSLGVTLYEALTGEVPFRGPTHLVLKQILDTAPRPPRQLNDAIPADLETICLKAIAKDPGRRYQTSREFADDLHRWERHEPILARPVSSLERGWQWCRREPIIAGLCAAFMLAILAGTIGVTSQWLRAEEKAREAKSHLALSQKDFRRALAAVDQSFTLIAENPDLKAQSFEPLRRELLLTARNFYEEFIDEHPHDPSLLAELGRAHGRIGQIVALLESRPASLPHYEKKQVIFQQLRSADPTKPDYADELADSLQRQAEAHRYTHELDKAQAEYDQAIQLLRDLVNRYPDNEDYLSHLIQTGNKLGDMLLLAQKLPNAEQTFLEGKSEFERYAKRHQPSSQLEAGLAYLNYGQARLFGAQGRGEQQEASLQAAIESFEKLAKIPQDADPHKAALGAVLNETGVMYARARNAEKANDAWRKAIAIYDQLSRAHPANVIYRSAMADVSGNLGTLTFFEQNQPEAAATALKDACETYERLAHDDPQTQYYGYHLSTCRRSLTDVYLHLKQWSDVIAITTKVIDKLDASAPEARLKGSDYLEFIARRSVALRQLNRFDEALADCDRALAVATDEQQPAWTAFREITSAFKLLNAGEYSKAVQLAGGTLRKSPPDAGTLALVAQLNLQAVARVRSSTTLPPDEVRIAERYLSNAMMCLQAAHKKGGFMFEFQRQKLTSDPEFEALRNRDDFQQLLTDIKTKPGGQ